MPGGLFIFCIYYHIRENRGAHVVPLVALIGSPEEWLPASGRPMCANDIALPARISLRYDIFMKRLSGQSPAVYFYISAGLMVCAAMLFHPVSDNDFFWHLKTGEWIVQHRALPADDLFTFPDRPPLTANEQFFLKQYWLSEVLYYFFFLGGWPGIFVMRLMVAALLFYVLLVREHGDNVLYGGLLVIFAVLFLSRYPLERPQVFSFVFFGSLLYLLEKNVRSAGQRPFSLQMFAVPCVMLLWANAHGGFIIGLGVLALYVIMEGIKFIHPALGPVAGRSYTGLVAAGLTGLAASLLNPNGADVLKLTYTTPLLVMTNMEYQSMLVHLTQYRNYFVLADLLVMVLVLAGIAANFRNLNITELPLVAGTGYYAFSHVRFTPFFLIAVLPVVSRNLSSALSVRWLRRVVLVAAAALVLYFLPQEIHNPLDIAAGRLVDENRMPVQAAEFIAARNLKGNMYNDIDWGGYLTWRFAPGRKVFIDGRIPPPQIYWDALAINLAYAGGEIPRWKSLLNRYGVNFVIIPRLGPPEGPLNIAYALTEDSDWAPVFADHTALVFLRNSPENSEIIRRYALSRKDLP